MSKFLLLFLFFLFTARTIDTSLCAVLINQTSPLFPAYCNQSTASCLFTQGLNGLADQSASQFYFSLCIILPKFNVTLPENANDNELNTSIYIESENQLFSQNYTIETDYQIVLIASNSIQTSNSTMMSGSLVWMQAPSILINQSKIQNLSSIDSDCSCYDQSTSNCTQSWDLNFPLLWTDVNSTQQFFNLSIFGDTYNFTQMKYNSIILYGNTSVNVIQSQIVSSLIGIFSQNVTITNQSLISTTGNGFPSATGFGCGYFDQILNQLLGCTGSGGSYGGFGGNSWPDNCNLMISRPPYQLNQYPTSPGSGGGFFLAGIKQASSGGGVINIQATTINIWNSDVQANGKAGTQGGGGGSGGSVSLDYMKLSGNSTISADGGQGKSSGGGGRVWLWNHNWRYQAQNKSESQFTITAQGGPGCLQMLSCGLNGSITTSPCQPGFQINLNNFICEACQSGTYQSQYGYSQCQKCLNKPANSEYVVINQDSVLFEDMCNYECSNFPQNLVSNYTKVNGLCLSSFTTIINQVGGINFLISGGLIICAIIGYLIIVLFQKLTQKELFNQKLQQDVFQRRMHFRVEDVPFHEKRIYFSGSNSPSRPWVIPDQTRDCYKRFALAPITKLDNILSKLCKQINILSKYSNKHSIFMTIVKFYYYPLWRYIEQLYRVEKSEAISKLVIQTNKKIPESQNLAIKFHVQPYCTIGCLEVFNYNKSALDFYIQDYFPIYFQLQKMPLGGYAIDLNDPFMKAFIREIDHKDIKSMDHESFLNSSNKIYEKYIIELDSLLRNTEQLIPILNHLWMMTQYNPLIQVYLYQHGNKILGVEAYYKICIKQPLYLVFSSQNINKHHFVSQQPLKNIYHHNVEYFNNQYKFRQEVNHEDKKSVFWQIENSINEKVLSWSLGITTIFILLQVVIEFFILIFIQAQKQVQFTYGVVVYFLVFPFSQFFSVYLCFRLILSKNCKILADSLYFTLGNIVKFLIIIILGLTANISDVFENILMSIIFYLWILSLVCNIISIFLKLLLHWHYSRHRGEDGVEYGQNEKKLKIQ